MAIGFLSATVEFGGLGIPDLKSGVVIPGSLGIIYNPILFGLRLETISIGLTDQMFCAVLII